MSPTLTPDSAPALDERLAAPPGPGLKHAETLTSSVRRLLSSPFIRDIAETFGTRLVLIGIGLATTVIVARILGPEGRGAYAIAVAIGAIGVQFGNLGLHASNTYYVARDRSLLPHLVGNSLVVAFGLGGVGALLCWAIFAAWPRLAPLHGELLALALVWIPIGLAYLLLQNLLLGVGEVRSFNALELGSKILTVLLIGGTIVLGLVTPPNVFAAGLVALGTACGWGFWKLRGHLRGPVRPSRSLFSTNLRYGIRAYVAALFAFLVLRVDLLMVQYILGPEQTGYYSIAVSMADMILMLAMVTGTLLFPKLSAMSNPRQQWKLARKVSVALGAVVALLAGLAAALADPAVVLLFGSAFAPAVPAFVWLLPGIVLLSINIVLMNYFAARGMPPVTVYSPAAAAAINLALNLVLIPHLGIVGASIASVAAYAAMLAMSVIYVRVGPEHRNA